MAGLSAIVNSVAFGARNDERSLYVIGELDLQRTKFKSIDYISKKAIEELYLRLTSQMMKNKMSLHHLELEMKL